ncbi:ATP-binding protein [Pseudomonas sp. PP3]|uniref:ATP-binding protein n=1 Tax=Pseudomonas sp. PP3 TaxID=2815936 RepID=UPI001FD3A514|nr:ATP-binding protein [Pseudomonas sp. PP3]
MFQDNHSPVKQGFWENVEWLDHCALTLLRHEEYLTYLRIRDLRTDAEWDAARASSSCPIACQQLERDFRIPLDAEWAVQPLAFIRSVEGPMVIYPRSTNLQESTPVGGFTLSKFLEIAIAVAHSLARSHSAGVVHGCLTPMHIAVTDSGVRLNFFKSRDGKKPSTGSFSETQWPYIAPEQMRDDLKVNGARSDVYSLGVVLYEVLTRRLPFQAMTLVQWLHLHAAVQPINPSEIDSEIPEIISRIILKCLAKEPDDRYQSVEALVADLAHSGDQLAEGGRISSFDLGLLDKPLEWSMSSGLIGREAEECRLTQSYQQVASSGHSAVTVLSGVAGEGKSSLVRHWIADVMPEYWASGRSKLLQREIPYAPFRTVLSSLAKLLTAQSFAELERLKVLLTSKLGNRGQLIVDLCPCFSDVLGPLVVQPTVPAVHAVVRANQTLLDTFEVFGSHKKPLVLFIDDLQWADESTLSLLHAFIENPPKNVYLIVAHRTAASSKCDDLNRFLEKIDLAQALNTETIALKPFSVETVAQFLSSKLNMTIAELDEVALLVHLKTAGNPFFIVQILRALIDDKLLIFENKHRRWAWLPEEIARHRYADNVADLMVNRLSRLPIDELGLMRLASCVGVKVQEGFLSELSELEDFEFTKAMKSLIEAGFLMHENQFLNFPHDRIHEAAYSLTDFDVRPSVHGHIAQAMIRQHGNGGDFSVFEIANHIRWSAIAEYPNEVSEKLISILMEAATLARNAGAVRQACDYLTSATAVLTCQPDGGGFAFSVKWLATECYLSLAELDKAESLIGQCFAEARSDEDRASTYRLLATLKTLRSDHEGAICAALTGLDLVGSALKRKPDDHDLDEIYDSIRSLIGSRSITDLHALPRMTDPRVEVTMELLTTLLSSFFTHDGLGFLHLAKMVELTLIHGTSSSSCYGLAWFGVRIASRYEEYEYGHAFVQLALDIGEQRGYEAGRPSSLLALDQVSPWTLPLDFAKEQAMKAFEIGSQGGDVVMACYAVAHIAADMLVMGETLPIVLDELERGMRFVRKFDYFDVERITEAQRKFVTDLQHGAKALVSPDFEQKTEYPFDGQEVSPPTRFWTVLYAGMSACIMGDAESAIRHFEAGAATLWSVSAHINLSNYYLYYSLALGHQHAPGTAESKLVLLAQHRRHIALWTKLNPSTFRHKLLLIDGVIARLEGQDVVAIRNFDHAGIAAAATGAVHEQAIAHEQLAQTCICTGLISGTNLHLRIARDCYRLWGAGAKVERMEQEHSFLTIDPIVERYSVTLLQEQLDMEAGIGVAKAVSEEVHLDRLIETFMKQMMLYSGADSGVLVGVDGANFNIAVSASVKDDVVVSTLEPLTTDFENLPLSVLYATARTAKPLVIDDAMRQCPIAHRADLSNRHIKSMLCLPLVKQGNVLALLYLENKHTSRLFDHKKLTMLELLASQAAMSLYTARIYAHALEESRLRAKTELELSASQAELARSTHSAVLGELAASIAHEISQPLLSIMTNSAASLSWLNREDPDLEEVRTGLHDICVDVQRATDIVRALRSLATQTPMQILPISVDDIIRDVMRLLLPKISSAAVRVHIELSAPQPVPGDSVQIQQLLFNLITNALDAMYHQRAEGRVLTVRTYCDERWLHTSIEDNGPGIPEENVEKVFNPFFTTKGSGMGMGLSICRSILDAHSGRLTIDTTFTAGCRMLFKIPLGPVV